MSPMGNKKSSSFLSGRTIPAVLLCVLFCAFFIYLHLSIIHPAGALDTPVSAPPEAYDVEESAEPVSPSPSPPPEPVREPSPALLRRALSTGSSDRFSMYPRLDSGSADSVFFTDTVKYDFADGHGIPIYQYEWGMDIPESAAVDDEYFTGSAFIGNSIMEGFMLYGGIKTADYYAKKSINVVNIETEAVIPTEDENITILDALAAESHCRIFILLGINEISFSPETFCRHYSKLIGDIREIDPDAELYILSLTPVSEKKAESSPNYSKERIDDYNQNLRRLAVREKTHFVDIYSCLADEDGYLPEDASFDGVHPYSQYYLQWADYLKTHTVGSVK